MIEEAGIFIRHLLSADTVLETIPFHKARRCKADGDGDGDRERNPDEEEAPAPQNADCLRLVSQSDPCQSAATQDPIMRCVSCLAVYLTIIYGLWCMVQLRRYIYLISREMRVLWRPPCRLLMTKDQFLVQNFRRLVQDVSKRSMGSICC